MKNFHLFIIAISFVSLSLYSCSSFKNISNNKELRDSIIVLNQLLDSSQAINQKFNYQLYYLDDITDALFENEFGIYSSLLDSLISLNLIDSINFRFISIQDSIANQYKTAKYFNMGGSLSKEVADFQTQLLAYHYILESIIAKQNAYKKSNKRTIVNYSTESITITKKKEEPLYKAKHITFRKNKFDIIRIKSDKVNINFSLMDKEGIIYGSIDSIISELETKRRKIVFATNGGMYKPNQRPQGLYIENGKTITPIKTGNGYGNFFMNWGEDEPETNGIFIINTDGTSQVIKANGYESYEKEIKHATQSGPLLLFDGEINPFFNEGSKNKYIRSGVGIIDSTEIVFIISNKPVNFYDFALLFKKKFACKNALYLDGAISRMYLPHIQRNQKGGSFGCIISLSEDR